MLYLAIGAAALWFLLRLTGGGARLGRREWRLVSGVGALAAFAGAAYAGLREAWAPAIVLAVMGLWLATTARINGGTAPAPSATMSLEDARSILGVDAGASPAEIKAAYARLMRMAHPDKGGTTGLAAQLNAARDRLLHKG